MRNVEFKEVGMENFGPYMEPMVHVFQNDTLTLLTGPNGVGKTMSLDAIPYTLYGITSKKAKGDDVVNNIVGKNCKTWVKFKVNNDNFLVTRYHKYTKLGNTVIINKNNVDIFKGQREVLPEIERLLCSQKAFMNTLMFGQKVKDFFTDLVDSDKKEIFRKILGTDQYIIYYKQADQYLKNTILEYEEIEKQVQIKQEILADVLDQLRILKEAKDQFYIEIKKEINKLQVDLDSNKRFLKKWEATLEELKLYNVNFDDINKQISDIEYTLANSKTKTKTVLDSLEQQKQAKLSDLQNTASQAKLEVKNSIITKLDKLNNQKADLIKEKNNIQSVFQQKVHNIEIEKSKTQLEHETLITKIEKLNKNINNTKNSICPTCEQEISEAARERLLKKVESYKRKIESFLKTESSFDDDLQKLNQQLKQELEKIDEIVLSVSNEITSYKENEIEQYEEIEERFKLAKQKLLVAVESERKKIIEQENSQTKDLQNVLFSLRKEKEKHERKLEELKKVENIIVKINQDIKNIANTIEFKKSQTFDESQLNLYMKKKTELLSSIEIEKSKIDSLKEMIKIGQFWKTGFSPSGIPSMLIDEAIPFMNRKIAEYLDMLTNGRYIVSFDTLDETKSGEFRDKISVHVVDTQTQANARVQLSGGQTRIIDIATILTLGDLQAAVNDVNFNILLFDEIFDALDYDNVGYVSKVLNKLKIGKSIFIISHQYQDQLEPDKLLTLS